MVGRKQNYAWKSLQITKESNHLISVEQVAGSKANTALYQFKCDQNKAKDEKDALGLMKNYEILEHQLWGK